MIVTYFDPGLQWLSVEPEPEPDPIDTEVLTVAADTGTGWWSAATPNDEE